MDQMDLTAIDGTFDPTVAENTFFTTSHGTFSKIDYILVHKASLSKYNKVEIIPPSDWIRIESNLKSAARKTTETL